MLTTLLFIAIIISCKTFVKGFAKFHRFPIKINRRMISFSKTKLNIRLTSTRFYDDDGKDKRNKKYSYNYESDSNFNNIQEERFLQNIEKLDNEKLDNEILYTLIWFNCEDCKKLLKDIKNESKQILYIDGTYYFFDENDETNTPLFYKNDELIATDVFSIYEELFYNTINEE
jgi:predicted ATP-grasp superfamily ATP-dependent carboligase